MTKTLRAIRAELAWDDTCTALGVIVRSPSPVLALCRELIKAGHDPATPFEAYRGSTLALRIRSVGEAAGVEVNGEGTGFRLRAKPGRASLVRPIAEAAE